METSLLRKPCVKRTGTIEDSISEPLRASGETIEYVAGTGSQTKASFLQHTLPDLVARAVNSGSSIACLHIGYEPPVNVAIQTQVALEIADAIRTKSARIYMNISPPDTRRTEELVGAAISDADTGSVVKYIARIQPKLAEIGKRYGITIAVGAAIVNNTNNPYQGMESSCDLTTAAQRTSYVQAKIGELTREANQHLQKIFRREPSGVGAAIEIKRCAA